MNCRRKRHQHGNKAIGLPRLRHLGYNGFENIAYARVSFTSKLLHRSILYDGSGVYGSTTLLLYSIPVYVFV